MRGGSGGTSLIQFTDNAISAQWGVITSSSSSCDIAHGSVLQFSTASFERARITSAGLVGIGTTAPDVGLHYRGDTPKFRIESTNTLEATSGTEEIGRLEWEGFKTSNFTVAASIRARQDGTWSTLTQWVAPSALEFYTQNNTGVEVTAPRMLITSAGLVGIGTSAPDTLLTVSQSAPTDGILAKLVNPANASGSEAGIRLQHNNSTQLQCDLVTFRSGANAGLDFNIKLSNSAGTPQTRFTILEGGNVGIGTTSPGDVLEVTGNIGVSANTGSFRSIGAASASNTTVVLQAGSASGTGGNIELHRDESIIYDGSIHVFRSTDGTAERARIDSSGRLLLGKSTSRGNFYNSTQDISFQIEGTTFSKSSLSIVANGATDSINPRPLLVLGRTRGSISGNTIVTAGDSLGEISFQGADGTRLVPAATIAAFVDGTPGAINDMPGRLVFSTTPDGFGAPVDRMFIASNGQIIAAGAGTAASPAIVVGNDINSGIYSSGEDQVSISTNGQQSLSVASDGNVSVARGALTLGATAGGEGGQLTLANPTNTAAVYHFDAVTATGARIFTIANNTDLQIGQLAGTGGNVLFATSAVERLRINSAGNVGIGTSTPGSALEVNGTITIGTGPGTYQAGCIGFTDTNWGSLNRPPRAGVVGAYGFQSFAGTTRMLITDGGNVGIGTTSPNGLLHCAIGTSFSPGGSWTSGTAVFGGGTANSSAFGIAHDTTNGTRLMSLEPGVSWRPLELLSNGVVFKPDGSNERARIDSSGRLLLGTSTSISTLVQPYLQIHGTSENAFISANRWSNDTFGTALIFGKSRGGAVGTRGGVIEGDSLGEIIFAGDNGSSFSTGASIVCRVDGAVSGGGAGDMPGHLTFNTTPDGTQSLVERMRIRSNGNVGIGAVGTSNIRLVLVGSDATGANYAFYVQSATTALFYCRNDGAINTGLAALSPYNLTTGVAANCVIATDGFLYRSTSSARFKTDIQTLEDSYADALLDVRPVWYRSIAPGDTTHPDWGYWGFIAEEVAEIDPRLVFWKTHETQKGEDGNDIQVELEEPLAEGVQYDRFVPHLLNLIKRQQQAIETLEAKVAALEST